MTEKRIILLVRAIRDEDKHPFYLENPQYERELIEKLKFKDLSPRLQQHLLRFQLLLEEGASAGEIRVAVESERDLRFTRLERLQLPHASLGDANLTGAYLFGADLFGANLTGADLTGADLFGADLFGADLTGADLTSARLTRANLADANCRRTHFECAHLTDANCRHAIFEGAHLTNTIVLGTDFRGARSKNNKPTRIRRAVTYFAFGRFSPAADLADATIINVKGSRDALWPGPFDVRKTHRADIPSLTSARMRLFFAAIATAAIPITTIAAALQLVN